MTSTTVPLLIKIYVRGIVQYDLVNDELQMAIEIWNKLAVYLCWCNELFSKQILVYT